MAGKIKYKECDVDEILNKKNIKRIDPYPGKTTGKMKVECLIDGYSWITSFNWLQNTNCPKCSKHEPLCNNLIDKKLQEQNRDIIRIGNFNTNCENKILWQCIRENCQLPNKQWLASPDKILNAKRGCPSCSKKEGAIKNVISITEINRRLGLRNDVILLGKYTGMNCKVDWKCTKCEHIFPSTPLNVMLNGSGCPLCKNKHEMKLKELIVKHIVFDQFKHHKFFRIDGKRRWVDFYIKIGKKEVVIERQGEQHYGPVNFGQGYDQSLNDFENQKLRDERIRQYCKDSGIILLEIPYWLSENEIILELQKMNDLNESVLLV